QAPIAELLSTLMPCAAPRTLADADRAHIMTTLRETNWVVGGVNGAAARLGLKRTTLIAKMRKLGLSREEAEDPEIRQGAQAPRPAAEATDRGADPYTLGELGPFATGG